MRNYIQERLECYEKTLIILTVLLLSVLTAACSSSAGHQNSEENKAAVTHDLGKTNVPEHPKRVVVLELGFIDTLLDLGITPVGVADDNKAKQLINKDVLKKLTATPLSAHGHSQAWKNRFAKTGFDYCRHDSS